MWSRDTIRENGHDGDVVGSRFINIKSMQTNGTIEQIKLYEFNMDMELVRIIAAGTRVSTWAIGNGGSMA